MATDKQFSKAGDGLLVRAPGKINLSLLVKGERPDGYHDIESIMAKVNWYDEILIEQKTEDGGPRFAQGATQGRQRTEDRGQNNVQYPTPNVECRRETNIELICKGPYQVPEGEDNLVYKAAKMILDFRLPIADFSKQKIEGIRITLTKNMPAGSGLGSGSSDAAGTLMGINEYFKLGISKKKLEELAAKLGSDVAFFLDGPIALCTGRGEKVKKMAECEFRVLLIIPNISVSTKRVYANYRHDAAKFALLHKEITGHIEKNRIDLVCELCANMLQESCFELHPELGVLKKRIESLGIRPVCLSGSGSSMYCIINRSNEKKVGTYRDKLEPDYGCKGIIVSNNTW
ncbi:MAG: 4-(cytidine 5'-diphospho)-2-C-methyl-D-erythritol kinase [Sedimentisphaerales bacterium]